MTGRSAFGAELRLRRQAAGLSLTAFANRIHYSKGHLSKVESGDKPVSVAFARLCDASLDAGGELVALAVDHDAETRKTDKGAVDTSATSGTWAMRLSADGSGSFVLLPGDGAATENVFASGLGFASDRSSVDPVLVAAQFGDRFDTERTLGQRMSPLALLPVLVAETHMLRGLAAQSPPEDAVALWRIAARYAEYVGWMAQEAGDQRHALWWTRAAVRMSELAGDDDLRPYALVRLAEATLNDDDGRQTVDLARQAQTSGSASARVRGLAMHREAQGHALLGDHDACFDALARSVELLDGRGDQLSLGSINTPDLTSMIRGWCLFDLGRPSEAATLLEAGIVDFAATSSRARSMYGVRTTLAQATAGEMDRACELLEWLAPDLLRIDSETVRHDLRQLSREFRRRSTMPRARDLMPLLGDLLRGPEARRA